MGFAAETTDVIAHARAKIARKGCDLIVANDVSAATGVMGGDRNSVHLIGRDGSLETWPVLPKDEVARRLVRAWPNWLPPPEARYLRLSPLARADRALPLSSLLGGPPCQPSSSSR